MTKQVNYKAFYVQFEELDEICIINAARRADANKRASREFPTRKHKIIEGEPPEGTPELSISPITVSYEGWNPSEMPSEGGGGVNFTAIKSRDKEGK